MPLKNNILCAVKLVQSGFQKSVPAPKVSSSYSCSTTMTFFCFQKHSLARGLLLHSKQAFSGLVPQNLRSTTPTVKRLLR